MPILDFCEIPTAASGAARDTFELFAAEFLELLGFERITGPDRGSDGGRDLIVTERRSGIEGETTVRWLVSCKHKAHSGAAVSAGDEADIHDRVKTHGCHGFLGFYSTVPSSGLATKLNAHNLPFDIAIYDPERIERHLLSRAGLDLAKRFFPRSFSTWKNENPGRAQGFSTHQKLKCQDCDHDLLAPESKGIVVICQTYDEAKKTRHYVKIYWCCKGSCDRLLRKSRPEHSVDGWKDVQDLMIPSEYIEYVLAIINGFHRGDTYTDDALSAMKSFLLSIYPYVCRESTTKERERIAALAEIPRFL